MEELIKYTVELAVVLILYFLAEWFKRKGKRKQSMATFLTMVLYCVFLLIINDFYN